MTYPDYSNNKISVLVQDQLPEFVRNNYPLFVDFIEAYYEYLEQSGKLVNTLNNIPNYLNIDYLVENNLTEFVEAFREMYMNKIPSTVLADKAKLLKHIRTFYSSKGTEKSFKFLFRALFNENVTLFNTGSQVLKASDGKWYQPFVLRIASANAISLWSGTQIFGQESFAQAVVETGYLNQLPNITYQELTLSNLTKNFLPSEQIIANTGTQTLYGTVLGIISSITVTNPGQTYNVGDVVPITGGGGANATAEISMVSPGSLSDVGIIYGGSGYETFPNWTVNVSGPGLSGVNAVIFSVDTSGTLSPNSFIIIDDIISAANDLPLNGVYSNFNTANINIQSQIINAATVINYGNCGPILLTHITSGGTGLISPPSINVYQSIGIGNSQTYLANIGAIGRFTIVNGGLNYSVNDDLMVTNIYSTGSGGAGRVTSVAGNGAITGIVVDQPSISGYANVTSGSNVVIGNGTLFTSQLLANNVANAVGSGTYIIINGESHQVSNISNNTFLTVTGNYAANATQQVIRLDGYMKGGVGYVENDIPGGVICSIRSLSNGSGAIIQPEGLLGQDAVLTPVGSLYGQIETITVTNVGDHYTSLPHIDLTHLGNGLATAVANPVFGIFQYAGYYLNEDGMLSARRYLQDPHVYNNYSYSITSPAVVSAYYDLVYHILNPVGMNMIGITQIPVGTGQLDLQPNGSVYVITTPPRVSINFLLDLSILT